MEVIFNGKKHCGLHKPIVSSLRLLVAHATPVHFGLRELLPAIFVHIETTCAANYANYETDLTLKWMLMCMHQCEVLDCFSMSTITKTCDFP